MSFSPWKLICVYTIFMACVIEKPYSDVSSNQPQKYENEIFSLEIIISHHGLLSLQCTSEPTEQWGQCQHRICLSSLYQRVCVSINELFYSKCTVTNLHYGTMGDVLQVMYFSHQSKRAGWIVFHRTQFYKRVIRAGFNFIQAPKERYNNRNHRTRTVKSSEGAT